MAKRAHHHVYVVELFPQEQMFGLRQPPDLYEAYNPTPYEAARSMEVEWGISLRAAGFGVWRA